MAAMASPPPPTRVCVTGAGGFIGSWLVKLLLSRGYAVHATLRDPCDPKNAHLKQLDGASEMLSLFKADVLDAGELSAAIAGCEGVFHVASPVPGDKIVDPELEVMAPAVKGTLNVLEVCSSSKKVQKVVVVSSTAAVHYNPNWPPGKPKDESCWSDRKICMEKKEWYSASKVIAEKMALEYAEKKGLNVVTVCPCLVFGPQLQPTVNTSNELLIYITKGGPNVMRNMLLHIVDVRDVAEALILSLGWKPRKLEETLTDSIEYYEKTGILQDAGGRPCLTLHTEVQWWQPEMTPPPPPPRRLVCVTGAGGFIGSWLVKLLLSRGYAVHATVRDPHDPKNAFLKQLENAPENLRLFKADVLDGGSLTAAFAGCEGVFHPATPVPEEKTKEMLDPAVKGTRNVLEACSAAGVQKLVVVSSIGAVCFNPSLPRDRIIDETCWSDKKSCKENENWYCLAKTEAEEMALEYSEKNGLHVITVCPALVLGPTVADCATQHQQQRGPDAIGNTFFPIVDVRDVADALLLVYDKAGPSERYICSQEQMDTKDFLDLMKSMYPNYSYTFKVVDVDTRVGLTSEKLKKLGWKPRKLEETLVDSVESHEKAGLVDDEPCRLPYLYRMTTSTSPPRRRVVCVTGAGGFVGSWLCLDMDPGNLHLFKADELDGDAMTVAFAGCEGVFHIGTPVPKYERVDPQAIGVTDMWWQPEMTPPPPPPRRPVCVTGAGGFTGSWLVKLLLSRGYAVHATLRDPDDPKNAFLKQLENAPENLRLFKADVLDGGSLTAAFAGCEGVFHPATPVPEHKTVDPEKEMLAPAVKGTRNVLEACSAASVQKLVVVSSICAVCFNPSLPRDRLIDETCWSDKKSCKENENWYCLAKTEAEEMALEYSEKNGLHVITVCPGVIFGPLLQTVLLNTSSKVLLYIMKGGPDALSNKFFPIVDVRDVADALLLVYDKAGPSERYICSQEQMDMRDLLDLMKSMYPNYSYTAKVVDVDMTTSVELTSEKLKKLGWKPRKLEETLVDSVESYKKAGFVDDEPCRLPHLYRAPDAQDWTLAPGNLHLFKADELNGDALTVAFTGCEGVFHTGTSVPEDETMLDKKYPSLKKYIFVQ
uniref:NAD-dependent epimerase/dehydratase domain-containing protein n=1 Tax=Oryza rufipogon TaxID=4529 RepID=A0A0E0QT54_ORYRU